MTGSPKIADGKAQQSYHLLSTTGEFVYMYMCDLPSFVLTPAELGLRKATACERRAAAVRGLAAGGVGGGGCRLSRPCSG